MFKKIFTYAFIISFFYLALVGYLGFTVREDYFVLTFPSWPLLINCIENCGYWMLLALLANTILVGILSFALLSLAFLGYRLTRKPKQSLSKGKKGS